MRIISTLKAQAIVIDTLFYALIIIFIIFIEIQYISNSANNEAKLVGSTKYLDTLLFTDKVISNCNYWAKSAKNYESLCYQNVLEINQITITKLIPELQKRKICKIFLSGNLIYNTQSTEIKYTVERGVINNGVFTTIQFRICK
ncbi:MAG: hypothetical protein WCX82_00915 [archaeon]|jgi:hypothetical protein